MFENIVKRCHTLVAHFNEIGEDRSLILQKMAAYIQYKIDQQQTVNLLYVCTHNSRRSHLGQVWAAVAANYYGLSNIQTYSGGTEATAFNANAIKVLADAGFNIQKITQGQNPLYKVYFGEEAFSNCFSKVYNDVANPQQGFAAIITCSDAEYNCPLITGCELRIGITYEDPKAFDGTVLQLEKYQERSNQIALECLYVFSLIRKHN
ncbi:MAG: protein-tyrosine-phosphatase [Ferruginibacter sp.]